MSGMQNKLNPWQFLEDWLGLEITTKPGDEITVSRGGKPWQTYPDTDNGRKCLGVHLKGLLNLRRREFRVFVEDVS